ncbi:UNKNOWN [Stylonychia lemnae]|uniref:Uncharacterized protein n=1 Tax=Stylonychia lemnae TaxID=5949 RepID=A0A078AWC7_STYLE|nr:UNKNOWN [Stylonychia lemnae]|eukprot:CDW85542.1 UNKNOWN [Stylonychia lemnae]
MSVFQGFNFETVQRRNAQPQATDRQRKLKFQLKICKFEHYQAAVLNNAKSVEAFVRSTLESDVSQNLGGYYKMANINMKERILECIQNLVQSRTLQASSQKILEQQLKNILNNQLVQKNIVQEQTMAGGNKEQEEITPQTQKQGSIVLLSCTQEIQSQQNPIEGLNEEEADASKTKLGKRPRSQQKDSNHQNKLDEFEDQSTVSSLQLQKRLSNGQVIH